MWATKEERKVPCTAKHIAVNRADFTSKNVNPLVVTEGTDAYAYAFNIPLNFDLNILTDKGILFSQSILSPSVITDTYYTKAELGKFVILSEQALSSFSITVKQTLSGVISIEGAAPFITEPLIEIQRPNEAVPLLISPSTPVNIDSQDIISQTKELNISSYTYKAFKYKKIKAPTTFFTYVVHKGKTQSINTVFDGNGFVLLNGYLYVQ